MISDKLLSFYCSVRLGSMVVPIYSDLRTYAGFLFGSKNNKRKSRFEIVFLCDLNCILVPGTVNSVIKWKKETNHQKYYY